MVVQMERVIGAGEGVPTLDSDLGKVEVPQSNYEVLAEMVEIALGFKAGHGSMVRPHRFRWLNVMRQPEPRNFNSDKISLAFRPIQLSVDLDCSHRRGAASPSHGPFVIDQLLAASWATAAV